MAAPPPDARAARAARFGIDCGDGVRFAAGSWAVGGEYVQRLPLQNVTGRSLHLRYTLPRHRVFYMAYPDPLVLPPGVTTYLEVRFRPVAYARLEDAIVCGCETGTFCPLASVTPTPCPAGAFCASAAMSAPTPCTLGSYCATTGLSAVTSACFSGEYCPTASSAAAACAAGSVCSNASSQIACSSGEYCPASTTAAASCTAGSFCATPASPMALCAIGYYCPSGSTSATQVTCLAGAYHCAAGASAPVSIACAVGYESDLSVCIFARQVNKSSCFILMS